MEAPRQPAEAAVPSPQIPKSTCATSASSPPELLPILLTDVATLNSGLDAVAAATGSGANGGPTRSAPEAECQASVESSCVRHENDKAGDTGSNGHEHMHMQDMCREKRDEQEMDVDDNSSLIEDMACEKGPKTSPATENAADVSVAPDDYPLAKAEAAEGLTSGDSRAPNETTDEDSSSSSYEEVDMYNSECEMASISDEAETVVEAAGKRAAGTKSARARLC